MLLSLRVSFGAHDCAPDGPRRACHSRAARVGLVRLGQLGLLHHRHHRGLSHLLRHLRRQGSRAGAGHRAVRAHHHDLGRGRRGHGADPRRACRLQRHQEAAAGDLHDDRRDVVRVDGADRRRRHHARVGAVLHRQHRRLGLARCSTTRCCRTSRSRAKPIACRRPATRWATSAAACCCSINLAWILCPATFGFANAAAATRASFVAVAIWWAVFSIPLFLKVPEPPAASGGERSFVDRHRLQQAGAGRSGKSAVIETRSCCSSPCCSTRTASRR